MRLRPRIIRLPAFDAHRSLRARLPAVRHRTARFRPVEMILRRLRNLVIRNSSSLRQLFQSHRTNVHMAPAVHPTSWREARPLRHEVRVLALREVVRQILRSRSTRVIDRMTPTAPPAGRQAMVTRPERHAIFPRVSVTMARTPAAAAARREAAAREKPVTNVAMPTVAQARRDADIRAAEPLSLRPQELSRLTDHVIRQLDRRVLSYRERTGRA